MEMDEWKDPNYIETSVWRVTGQSAGSAAEVHPTSDIKHQGQTCGSLNNICAAVI